MSYSLCLDANSLLTSDNDGTVELEVVLFYKKCNMHSDMNQLQTMVHVTNDIHIDTYKIQLPFQSRLFDCHIYVHFGDPCWRFVFHIVKYVFHFKEEYTQENRRYQEL
jgi:hypothetical protein